MIGIVVTGHAHFPSGLLSAIELVAGKQENVVGVDFESGQSSEDLTAALGAAVEALEGDEVLVLADLVGGTPFNRAALLQAQFPAKRICVMAGINMAGMVEAVFSRTMFPFGQLADQVERAVVNGVVNLNSLREDGEQDAEEAPEFEDGL